MVNIYTGIENIDAFNTKFDMVSPIVRKQWSGYKKLSKKIRNFKKMPKQFGPTRKLCTKGNVTLFNETEACLMELRLGFTLHDLANRLKVSLFTASSVFTS